MVGCDQKEYKTPAERGVSNSTTTQTSSLNSQASQSVPETAEERELKDILVKMKQQDPSIVDAYYSVDDSGQKILNLVKEEPSTAANTSGSSGESTSGGSGLSTFMWAMAGGLTASALFNAFNSNKGNMSAMTNQYRPMNTQRGTYSSYQAQKQSAVSQYRSKFTPVNRMNSNRLAPTNNSISRPTTPVTNATTNKFTPVTPNTVTGAPLSKDAYRTQVVTKPKPTTSSYNSTQVTKKPSVFKRSGSIFGKRR